MQNSAIIQDARVASVGDYVGFTCDGKQSGWITEIKGWGRRAILTVENKAGFDGEYIGGDKEVVIYADRCWRD